MATFLKSIQNVTGPLTLIAFLAVVALAGFRAWINRKESLQYLHDLLNVKLTPESFFKLLDLIVRRLFVLILVIFLASLVAWLVAQFAPRPGSTSSPTQASPTPLEIVKADLTELGELDVLVRNPGKESAVIHDIGVTVVEDHHQVLQPVILPSERITIPIDDLAVNATRKKGVAIEVKPNSAERFLVALETTRVLTIRLTLFYNKDQTVSIKKKIDLNAPDAGS
jgi:hypothetical protein